MFDKFDFLNILYMIPGLLFGFTIHEYAHAKVSDLLGDKTARFQGRLTLNPLAHIDITGFVLIFFVGVGWAKPVKTNPRAFKNPDKDEVKVALAGPIANLIGAFISSMLLGIFYIISLRTRYLSGLNLTWLRIIIINSIYLNSMMFIFNLIPFVGFDGSYIIKYISPNLFYKLNEKYYQYRYIVIAIIILTPVLNFIRVPISGLTNVFLDMALKFI